MRRFITCLLIGALLLTGWAAAEEGCSLDEYIGCYESGFDTVAIEKTDDGYAMLVGLYRLTSLDEGTVTATQDGVLFETLDAAGEPMTVLFYRDGETYALRIEASTWPLLEAGTVFDGFVRREGGFSVQPVTDHVSVSYLGPQGTYTEEAARQFFLNGTFLPETTVEEAIADLVAGDAQYAVIPQENTLGGAVAGYVDALIAQENVYVAGEIILPISQTLMGVPGATLEDIQTVCSHAQGIVQSEAWRKDHLPDAITREMPSTAAAASFVAETGDRTVAAIAAPGAAELYGLEVLAKNVQITDANRTRFYVLSTLRLEGGPNAVFVASCAASEIDDILVEIHDAGMELVTLHDRPEGSGLGVYHYIIEVETRGLLTDEVLNRLEAMPAVRFLGSFSVMEP